MHSELYTNYSILGVKISITSRAEVLEIIDSALIKPHSGLFVATLNPSFILQAQKNSEFKEVLNKKTSLNVVDGVGLKLAYHFLSETEGKGFLYRLVYGVWNIGVLKGLLAQAKDHNPQVVTGVSLTEYLLKRAHSNKLSVLIVNRQDAWTASSMINNYLITKYPGLNFKIIDISRDDYKKNLNDSSIRNFDITLCTLGEVYEELFLASSLHNLHSKISIGIGGTFDILTGKIKAKQGSQSFRWLFRLFASPRRFRKIFMSVVVFPLKVFLGSVPHSSFRA